RAGAIYRKTLEARKKRSLRRRACPSPSTVAKSPDHKGTHQGSTQATDEAKPSSSVTAAESRPDAAIKEDCDDEAVERVGARDATRGEGAGGRPADGRPAQGKAAMEAPAPARAADAAGGHGAVAGSAAPCRHLCSFCGRRISLLVRLG